MPDRVLRAELLESEAWLALKDNADRAAWVSCILTVDNFGDMPAGLNRLARLWRPYGLDTAEKAAHTIANLSDVDLARRYEVDQKPFIHIPRFKQRLRWVGHAYPLSPWASDEEKQLFAKKYPAEREPSPSAASGTPAEVKRSEVKRSEVKRSSSLQNISSAREGPQRSTPVEIKKPVKDGKTQFVGISAVAMQIIEKLQLTPQNNEVAAEFELRALKAGGLA